jgi:hypothetical protein
MVLSEDPRIQVRNLDGSHPARQISIVHRKRPAALVTALVRLLRQAA